ncbi:MAG TPA: CDP-diacylglycerol--serine O-phosphatidyltransferase [Elusimicrobiota bacterium]|jgi:CDP-diacylglycerol---serine O-phosphatidyltransferase|nr:CDP-diacylglycerol--serine O-phosphatidyltransferase [Elusimicrobiota bacterium]
MNLRRGRLLAPSLFTLGNMACGFYALLSIQREEFVPAATAILLGMVFDALDGRVARFVHGESTFGVEFDSLSDFLTFGIAPAHMMYAFILKDYGVWGYPMAFVYALCGGLRLARFNAGVHDHIGSKTHFTGLPIPGGAGFLASFVLLYQIIEQGRPARTWTFLMNQIPALYALAPAMVLIIAFLMISTIPYPAFKKSSLLRPRSVWLPPLLVFAAAVIVVYPQNAIFLIFFAYVLLGPVGWLLGLARRIFWRTPPAGPTGL